MNHFASLPLADRLAMTLDGLAQVVAARSAWGPSWLGRLAPLAAALIGLVWRRVKRTERRIVDLLIRFQTGRMVVRAPAARRAVRKGVPGGAVKGVPQRPGWLLPLVPCEAANYASRLRALLAEPEMVALLRASAQARRILQPVCRMLAIELAVLMPEPEPESEPESELEPVLEVTEEKEEPAVGAVPREDAGYAGPAESGAGPAVGRPDWYSG